MPGEEPLTRPKSMHRARAALLNRGKEFIRTKEKVTHNELLRFFMSEGVLCRQVAETYINDLLFLGELKEQRDQVTLPGKEKPQT